VAPAQSIITAFTSRLAGRAIAAFAKRVLDSPFTPCNQIRSRFNSMIRLSKVFAAALCGLLAAAVSADAAMMPAIGRALP